MGAKKLNYTGRGWLQGDCLVYAAASQVVPMQARGPINTYLYAVSGGILRNSCLHRIR